jgi:tetratricopeptide (TPR) repeat protein
MTAEPAAPASVPPQATTVGTPLVPAPVPQDVESVLERRRAVTLERPASIPDHLFYLALMVRQGRRSEARAEYAKRAEAPDAPLAVRVMHGRLQTGGGSSALRRVYGAAIQAEPEEAWWRLALVEVELAEADAWNQRRLTAVERGDRTLEDKSYRQARGALARGQGAMGEAARLAPDMAEVHLFRGHLRAIEGDLHAASSARMAAYGAAEAAFAEATRRNPELVAAWRSLADVRYRRDDLGGALDAALEAARRDAGDASLREMLGVILHALERYDDAANQYREAARLAPMEAGPMLRLGDALADAERWRGALQAWEAALSRDPDALEAHRKSGIVLEHLGRRAEARLAFERYVEAGGDKAGAVERRIDRLVREDVK